MRSEKLLRWVTLLPAVNRMEEDAVTLWVADAVSAGTIVCLAVIAGVLQHAFHKAVETYRH